MSMVISGDGTITGLSAGGLPDGSVTQAEIATGVAGKGPAFSAYLGTTQTLTNNVLTKVQLNTEVFDTASCFDTTNYRFTPNVAGYYQVNIHNWGIASTNMTRFTNILYKNGAVYQYVGLIAINYSTGDPMIGGSVLVYLNGTTDYIEHYVAMAGTGTLQISSLSGQANYMSASLVRSA